MEAKGEIAANPMRGVEGIGGLDVKSRRAPTTDELRRMLEVAGECPMVFGQLHAIIRACSASRLAPRRALRAALGRHRLSRHDGIREAGRDAAGGRDVYFKAPKSAAGVRTIAMLAADRGASSRAAEGGCRVAPRRRPGVGRQRPGLLGPDSARCSTSSRYRAPPASSATGRACRARCCRCTASGTMP